MIPMCKLQLWPSESLKRKCLKVTEFDNPISQLSQAMFEIMYENKGIGLAANQVGSNKQVIVVDVDGWKEALINPVVIETSGNKAMEEGCLSFGSVRVSVTRPSTIVLTYQTLMGLPVTTELHHLKARVALHELDHLAGITFLDYVSPLKRKMIEKRFSK